MAHDKFEAANNAEQNALNTGDHAAGKVTFSEIMQGEQLTEAIRKSDAAVAAAIARVASVQNRIAEYFGDDTQGHNEFHAIHKAYYAQA